MTDFDTVIDFDNMIGFDNMTNSFMTCKVDKSFMLAVNHVITKIPDRFIDEDIAHAVQVLFCDLGAGANFTELKKVISIIFDHALPAGARNDKVVSLMAHIVRPKPAKFDLIYEGREAQAETLAHNIILYKVCFRTNSLSLRTGVWDRRPFDIVAEFADNYDGLQIREDIMKANVRLVVNMAARNRHLFRRANFDLFVRFVMDYGHMMDPVEKLQTIARRAKSQSRDVQFTVVGLLSVAQERQLNRRGFGG